MTDDELIVMMLEGEILDDLVKRLLPIRKRA